VGRLDGAYVVVAHSRPLPRVCVLCGARKKLRLRAVSFDPSANGGLMVGPVWVLVAGALLEAAQRTLNGPPPPPFEYWSCEPCERHGMNVRHVTSGLKIGVGVALLATATAGFNGAPIVAAVIFALSAAVLGFAWRKYGRGHRFAIDLRQDGVGLRDLHPAAADEILKARLPDVDAAA